MLLAKTLCEIAAAGGGLDIDVKRMKLLAPTLRDIAIYAARSGKRPTIIFRNFGPTLFPDTLVDIAAAGDGCVIFVPD